MFNYILRRLAYSIPILLGIIGLILTDISYTWVDPRVRLS